MSCQVSFINTWVCVEFVSPDVSVEGIFRKNGNIRRLKEVIEELEKDPGFGDFASDNPVQLAALLKKFFKELPDPLLTFKLHGLFIATQCELGAFLV